MLEKLLIEIHEKLFEQKCTCNQRVLSGAYGRFRVWDNCVLHHKLRGHERINRADSVKSSLPQRYHKDSKEFVIYGKMDPKVVEVGR